MATAPTSGDRYVITMASVESGKLKFSVPVSGAMQQEKALLG